ncbi:S24 family peptidase [Qipengyuania algicida]|uniref:S24 family peptidase n=1 Tax=Qipengyuania algicida TaxID=1836209 RepID=UPI00301D7EAB
MSKATVWSRCCVRETRFSWIATSVRARACSWFASANALHVKQLQYRPPGRVALISANEAYPPIDLAREEVEVIGRVVWKGGRI